MTTTRPHRWRVAVACTAAVLASGCAGSQDAAATAAARDLLAAVQEGDGGAACRVLAPPTADELDQTSGKPCDRAVLEEDLGSGDGPVRTEVFDAMAQVRLGADTVFLSRFGARWLVVAAACTPVEDSPYDCSIGLP
jgi:hypothetical protein